MRYNPMVDDLESAYPELCKMPAWRDYGGNDKVMLQRYVMMMYSQDSPMIRRHPDLDERKRECMYLAGYHITDDEGDASDLLDISRNEMVLDFILAYLHRQSNHLFQMLVSTEEAFQEYQRMILMKVSTDGKDKDVLAATTIKTKLMEDCHHMASRIDDYYGKLYGAEVATAVRERGRIRPEDYVEGV